jgi:hypothetical protein
MLLCLARDCEALKSVFCQIIHRRLLVCAEYGAALFDGASMLDGTGVLPPEVRAYHRFEPSNAQQVCRTRATGTAF